MDQKILDALKTINDKLGGTNDVNEKWGSLLQEIAENIDKTVELPSVTSDDNGDVLTVVDGAWDKAAPSGGGGGGFIAETEFVTNVGEYDNYGWMTVNTVEEIITAYKSGANVLFHGDTPSDPMYGYSPWWVTLIGYDSDPYQQTESRYLISFYPTWHGGLSVIDGKLFFRAAND